MTRVLYVGSGRPWAGGAGYLVRQGVFLRALADAVAAVGGELHLALFDLDKPGPDAPPYAAAVTPLPAPRRLPKSKVGDALGDLFSSRPRLDRAYDAAAPRAAVTALNPDGFDAVFAFRIDFAHHAGVLGHRRLILDVDDPEHTRWHRRMDLAAIAGAPADWRSWRDLANLRTFERWAEGQAKLAFVCQAGDAKGWPLTPEIVPNGIDLPAAVDRRPRTPPIVLFVGNCSGTERTPNVDAVQRFLADSWPAVRRAVPGVEFHLIGAAGEAARAAVAGAEGAVYRGFVDDLSDVYATAAVAVAPIRFGTGTRIKILEAFAHGCPVLTTPVGAEGIAAVPGREAEFGVTADDFAGKCVALLTDRPTAERIGSAGRALAERSYDAAVVRQQVAERLTAFLSAAQPALVGGAA